MWYECASIPHRRSFDAEYIVQSMLCSHARDPGEAASTSLELIWTLKAGVTKLIRLQLRDNDNDGSSQQRDRGCVPDPDLADLLCALRVLQHTRQPRHEAVLPRRIEAAPPRALRPRAPRMLVEQQWQKNFRQ